MESSEITALWRRFPGVTAAGCATFGKAFSTSSSLTAHIRSHTGDHPYTCTTCGMALSQS